VVVFSCWLKFVHRRSVCVSTTIHPYHVVHTTFVSSAAAETLFRGVLSKTAVTFSFQLGIGQKYTFSETAENRRNCFCKNRLGRSSFRPPKFLHACVWRASYHSFCSTGHILIPFVLRFCVALPSWIKKLQKKVKKTSEKKRKELQQGRLLICKCCFTFPPCHTVYTWVLRFWIALTSNKHLLWIIFQLC